MSPHDPNDPNEPIEYDEYGYPIEYDEYGRRIVYEYVDEYGRPINPDGSLKEPGESGPRSRSNRDDHRDDAGWDDWDGDDWDDWDDADPHDGSRSWETVRPRSRRANPVGLAILSAIAVIGIVVGGGLLWTARQINPSGGPGVEVKEVVIPSGATFADVAEQLESEGIIGSARVMGWYAKFADVKPVQAGRYIKFRKNMSMGDAIEVLNAGPVAAQSRVVTIIPGMWLSDALEAINKVFPNISVDELSLTLMGGKVTSKYHPDPTQSWEGFLLPETLDFAEDATAQEILQRFVDEFDKVLDNAGYQNAEARTGRTAYELVTIASMIEREKGDAEGEAEKVARVIFNRLDENMTLGIDATILYGLQRRGNEGGLTKAELEADGPYNSRTRKGLPPTPIALPSKASLEAAINPAEGDWLYYVLAGVNPREHFFTSSYDEFLDAKRRCDANGWC